MILFRLNEMTEAVPFIVPIIHVSPRETLGTSTGRAGTDEEGEGLPMEEPEPPTEEPGQRVEDLKPMKINYLHHGLLGDPNDQLDDPDEPEVKENVQCFALGETIDDLESDDIGYRHNHATKLERQARLHLKIRIGNI